MIETDRCQQPPFSPPPSRLASVGVAVPPYAMTQPEAESFLSRNYSMRLKNRSNKIMRRVLQHPSIRQRFFAFDSPDQLVQENPDARIERFTRWAVKLSAQAARSALEKAGLSASHISALVVNTCTGYICPGISTYLIEELGLSGNVRAYDLVGAGCGGAIPNLQLGGSLMNGDPECAVLCVSVEICSATFQMDDDSGLIVSNALFADGAGACVLWRKPAGMILVDSISLYLPQRREAIRYVHRNGQLHNQLSVSLPRLLKEPIAETVNSLLLRNSLTPSDVKHWAIHPGGDKVVEAIGQGLCLNENQLSPTRLILQNYGNVSSASVWFVLEQILTNGVQPGDWCVMLAAGAGLSIHAHLLRV